MIRLNVDTHIDKELQPAEERPAALAGRTFAQASQEADWIAREIARLRLEGLELGQTAVLARSLREIGPRLAYSLRRHNLPFFAPLESPIHPTVDALLAVLEVANAYPWEEPHEERVLRALASPSSAPIGLALRRFRRERRTLYGALRDSGDYDPFFEALGIVEETDLSRRRGLRALGAPRLLPQPAAALPAVRRAARGRRGAGRRHGPVERRERVGR